MTRAGIVLAAMATIMAPIMAPIMITVAHADTTEVDALAAQGEELAKTGEYTRAIDSFKRADKLAQKARHACMIGLAYLRREMWPQAELFFETCKHRASLEDPLPEWFQDAMTQLKTKLDGTSVSAVEIRVAPATAVAQITVSSFAPDEKFSARAIHLAPGTHTITVTSPEFPTQTRTFTVEPSTPLVVDVLLEHAKKRYVTPPASKVPLTVIIGGGAFVLAGVIYHVGALAPLRSDIVETADVNLYRQRVETFKTRRAITASLYGVGAIAIGVGFILRATVFERTPILVGAEPTEGGGVLSVSWSR